MDALGNGTQVARGQATDAREGVLVRQLQRYYALAEGTVGNSSTC